jgi:hypothetical protein
MNLADVRTGSKFLYQIEQAIEQIQMDKDVPRNLEIIRRMINLEFKATCEKVYLTKNITQTYFFGIHVFPTKKELYKIADKVIHLDQKVQFENCTEFVLELDSKLIYDIGATPKEITAAILHEIGHKVYSKKSQIRSKVLFLNACLKNVAIAGGALTTIARVISPVKFLLFSAILTCFTNSLSSWLRLKDEMDADSFAVKYGYAADLHSLIGKFRNDSELTLGFGKISKFARTTAIGSDESQRAIMRWSIKNILEFSIRRAEIARQLEAQLREEPSEYGREIIQEQLDQIRKAQKASGLRMSIQSSLKKEDALLGESVKSFIEIQSKGMSYLELDELSVEIERIETYEDKIYIVSRIYRDLAAANKAMDKISKDNSNSGKLRLEQFKDYVGQLKDLLTRTRAFKVKETQYGVYVKYPKGDYEEGTAY